MIKQIQASRDAGLFRPSAQQFDVALIDEAKPDFAAYLSHHRQFIAINRFFLSQSEKERAQELAWVCPAEWQGGKYHDQAKEQPLALLLLHGLTDNGFSFLDMVPDLLPYVGVVRSIVLPDHGTRPGDLLLADRRRWQQMVRFALQSLVKDGWQRIVIIGHSLGGMLGLAGWLDCPAVKGLVLMGTPFTMAQEPLARQTAWLKFLYPWVNKAKEWNPACYNSLSFKAVHELTKLVATTRQRMNHEVQNRQPPHLLALFSEHDHRVNGSSSVNHIYRWWQAAPELAQISWYGHRLPKAPAPWQDRFTFINSLHPTLKLASASHVMFPFSENNPIYGRQALRKIKPNVWLGEHNMKDLKQYRPLQRLTFNPYFDDMMTTIKDFLQLL